MASLRLCLTFHAPAHAPVLLALPDGHVARRGVDVQVFIAASPDDAAPTVLARDPFSVFRREARHSFRLADLARLRCHAHNDRRHAMAGCLRLRAAVVAGGWIGRDLPFERCLTNDLAGQHHAA